MRVCTRVKLLCRSLYVASICASICIYVYVYIYIYIDIIHVYIPMILRTFDMQKTGLEVGTC